MGYTSPIVVSGGGGTSAPLAMPGRFFASLSSGGEYVICAVGTTGAQVTGIWLANEGAVEIVGDDTNGLSFTAAARNAAGLNVAEDYASTAADVEIFHGLGNVAIYGLSAYTFDTPLAVPAGGLVTIAVADFGAGRTLDAVTIGVYLAPA